MRRGLPLCFLLAVGCQTLARQTQWTDVVPQTGARKMQVYEIPSWGNGAPTLEIELPAGYTIESRKGADFDVHYLSRVTTDDAETGKIGIYVGHYPSLFESDQPPVEKVGRVGPKAVKWLCSDGQNGEGKHAFGCQTLVSGL